MTNQSDDTAEFDFDVDLVKEINSKIPTFAKERYFCKKNVDKRDFLNNPQDRLVLIDTIVDDFLKEECNPLYYFKMELITTLVTETVTLCVCMNEEKESKYSVKKENTYLIGAELNVYGSTQDAALRSIVWGGIYKNGNQLVKVIKSGLIREEQMVWVENIMTGDGSITKLQEKEFLDNYKLQ